MYIATSKDMLLDDIGVEIGEPIQILSYNLFNVDLARNLICQGRTMTIAI